MSLTGLGLGIAVVGMTLCWLLSRRRDFYSGVDVAWAGGIGLIGASYGALGAGAVARRLLASLLICAWSARLATHLGRRLRDKYPEEDRRYAKIKAVWGASTSRRFFWFFQFQAVSQPLLCIPFALAVGRAEPLGAWDWLAAALALAGVAGEALADSQLRNFKATGSRGVCDVGLWRHSRHPNYFFEWVTWCGFALFGLPASGGALSLLSPSVMFLLLNFVTGVPPTEAQSLSSRGELYRAYQRRTPRFFPGPVRGGIK